MDIKFVFVETLNEFDKLSLRTTKFQTVDDKKDSYTTGKAATSHALSYHSLNYLPNLKNPFLFHCHILHTEVFLIRFKEVKKAYQLIAIYPVVE
jgi:hypothetical protein